MKQTLVFTIALLISITLHAQDVSQQVDKYVEEFRTVTKVPGIALLVVKNGQTVKAQGYGLANIEHNVPVHPETIFQSGSIGKQFTAAAILLLQQDGKLNVQDPIGKYLKVPASWKGITIQHLLTHTSGLGDYPESMDFRKDYTEEELFAMVKKQKLQFAPGQKWSYSNLAYLTLGVLVRKVSGKYYGDFLQERVFQPLGMTSTRVISEADIIPNRAAGYRLVNEEFKNQEWVSPALNTTADGALYFNILDLAKWDSALNGNQLFTDETKKTMWTPVKLNDGSTYHYGYGWAVGKRNGHLEIEHGGAWQGFSTQISRYPDDQLTIAVLTNRSGAGAGYLAHAVAGFYVPEISPKQLKESTVAESLLTQMEGKFKLESGTEVEIAKDGNRLNCKTRNQKFVLIPASPDLFFMEYSELTVTPNLDSSGSLTSLTFHFDARDEKATRVK